MTTPARAAVVDHSVVEHGTEDPADLVAPLGATGWSMWRWSALRGAGFPAADVEKLCDGELAAAADRLEDTEAGRARYASEFAAATLRLTAAMRAVASDEAFREAVTWQNPPLARDCLDKVVRGERRNARGRYHELTVATYLQRYCLKNDTVGFFGPVGWARVGTPHAGVVASPHSDVLARRTTYLEHWPVAALADVLAERPEIVPWLQPRRDPSAFVEGRTVRIPLAPPLTLTKGELTLLRRCDGHRSVRDLAGDPPDPTVVATLLRLREIGVLRMDLREPMSTWPERELARRLEGIGDPDVRARALEPLCELVAARDELAAAAGDAAEVAARSIALAETFARITGSPGSRSAGTTYAGRTVAYEDTVRGIDVHIGQAVLDRLAGPLGLMLDSCAWVADALASRFTVVARERFDQETAAGGWDSMPFAQLLMTFMPEMSALGRGATESDIVDGVVADLQERWTRVFGMTEPGPDETGHLQFTTTELAARAAQEFPRTRAGWADAGWHSPDVMIAARDAAAMAGGDVDFVLGELHCAANTLRSRLFNEAHPARHDQRRLLETVDSGDRFVIVPRTDWPLTTPRMLWATETMLPGYTYLCLGEEAITAPPGADTVSVMGLDVVADGARLQVRDRRTGALHAWHDVLADLLCNLSVDAFRPVAPRRWNPRISIDRLVVARASVTLPAEELTWAAVRDEGHRFAQARRWRAANGLPERAFLRVPVERKPIAVDFRSLALVNVAAKAIRRSAEARGTVTVSEMLPDLDALWLTDGDGQRYTAELRLLAVWGDRLTRA